MYDTLTLDKAQIDAQIARFDAAIAEGEKRLAVLMSEVEQLYGERRAWQQIRERLMECERE